MRSSLDSTSLTTSLLPASQAVASRRQDALQARVPAASKDRTRLPELLTPTDFPAWREVTIDPPPEPEALRGAPVVGRVEAEANFDELMLSLEAIADRHDRLTRARREELYRNVNDAFAGLSATLDPASAQDMQLLEDANIRMKAMMQELGIREPLRPPPDAP